MPAFGCEKVVRCDNSLDFRSDSRTGLNQDRADRSRRPGCLIRPFGKPENGMPDSLTGCLRLLLTRRGGSGVRHRVQSARSAINSMSEFVLGSWSRVQPPDTVTSVQ